MVGYRMQIVVNIVYYDKLKNNSNNNGRTKLFKYCYHSI